MVLLLSFFLHYFNEIKKLTVCLFLIILIRLGSQNSVDHVFDSASVPSIT